MLGVIAIGLSAWLHVVPLTPGIAAAAAGLSMLMEAAAIDRYQSVIARWGGLGLILIAAVTIYEVYLHRRSTQAALTSTTSAKTSPNSPAGVSSPSVAA